jgi:hypothetical protein
LARALLLHLEEQSLGILAEVHGDGWQCHRWVHWIFPCGVSAETDAGPSSAITHRSVRMFLEADSYAWREVVERIVGRAEATNGGINGLFPPVMLARIDSFVSIFALASKRPEWLVRVLARIRRLRNLPEGVLVPGPMVRASRPSRRQREVDRVSRGRTSSRVPSMVLGPALPAEGVVGLGGAVLGWPDDLAGRRELAPISERPPGVVGGLPPTSGGTATAAPTRVLTPPPRLMAQVAPRRSSYLRSKGANAAIFGMLDGVVSHVAVPKLLFPIGRASIKTDTDSFFG